ncbi:ABC transporter ATP-binding protein/permease [Candidatus Pelagibacter sp.]|nr:ABC transporter ATP-binding protein/permease [Candidatus Pelagibacter sp.]
MYKNIKQVFKLLSFQKKKLYFLFFCLFVAIFLESMSIGIVLPIVLFISDPSQLNDYTFTLKLLEMGYSSGQIILLLVILLFLIFFIKFVYLSWLAWFKGEIIYKTEYEISKSLLDFMINKDIDYFLKNNSSDVLNLVITQCNLLVDYGIKSLINFISDFFLIVGILILLLVLEPEISIISFIFIGVSFYLVNLVTKKRAQKWSDTKIENETKRIKQLQEIIGLFKNIKLGSFEKQYQDLYNIYCKESTMVTKKQFFIGSIPRLFAEFSAIIVFSFIIFLMYVSNNLDVVILPTMALLAAASFRILPALGVLQMCLVNFRFASPIINTTYNLFFNSTQKENEKNIENPKEKIFDFKKDLKIENISFQYDQNQVLFDNANLEIKFGEIVGIEGKSGTGKSTLINIICGLKNVDKGKVLVDGIDINNDLKGWQKNLGYVPQNIFLKDNDIESNIIFGERNIEDKQKKLSEVLIQSNLNDFVQSLKKGVKSSTGEKGTLISGGQVQRIGIARGLYYSPKLLILDESTSSLDNESEDQILDELVKFKGKITLLIISHKRRTLKICEKIYKIENKKINLT